MSGFGISRNFTLNSIHKNHRQIVPEVQQSVENTENVESQDTVEENQSNQQSPQNSSTNAIYISYNKKGTILSADNH